jgi:thiamine pyrophosphokinase
VLNLQQQPLTEVNKTTIERLWNNAKLRVLVDGGANWAYDHQTSFPSPHIVCGDFDSIRASVKQFYTEQVELKTASDCWLGFA